MFYWVKKKKKKNIYALCVVSIGHGVSSGSNPPERMSIGQLDRRYERQSSSAVADHGGFGITRGQLAD